MDYNSYVKANFDTSGFFNNMYTCDNPSALSRISNALVSAINVQSAGKTLLLLKLVVRVPDDDILKLLQDKRYVEEQMMQSLGKLVNFIMTEYDRNISLFKEKLPAKCLRDYPYLLWIQPPMHDAFNNSALRFKFNKCLVEITKLHHNAFTLALKKVWDPKDPALYSTEYHRFTSEGYKSYLEAVGKTVRYFDSVVLKKNYAKKARCWKKSTSPHFGVGV